MNITPTVDSAQALDRFMAAQGFNHEARAAALAALAAPTAPTGAVPFETFVPLLLEQYGPSLRSLSTLRSMKHAVAVLRELGVTSTAELGDIRLITRVVASCDPALSPNTVKGLLRRMQCLIGHAVDMGFTPVSPFVKRPLRTWIRAVKPRGVRHLSKPQMQALFGLLAADVRDRTGWPLWRGRRLQALVVLIAYTGLRRSEALFLHVEDLDFDAGVVWVRSRASHRLKTDSSEKPVTLLPAAANVLRDWLLHRNDAPPGFTRPASPYVFRNIRAASPWSQGCRGTKPIDRLKSVGKRAGIELVTFQMLRRTVAVAMEIAGASAAQIQRQLRHSNITVTQQYYMAADRDGMRSAMSGFGYDD